MQGSILKFPVYALDGMLWAFEGAAVSSPQRGLETRKLVWCKTKEEDAMKRWTLSVVCVVLLVGIGLTASLAGADEDERLSVAVAFGRGLNTAQPGNVVNHVVLPKKTKIKQGGVVHFLVAGFHQPMVYKPGTKPEDIVVPASGTFINDLSDLFYQGINPAGGPLETPATPIITPDPTVPDDTRSNASNRVESVAFPVSEGPKVNGVPLSAKAEPGVYLVICNVRQHFLDGMFAFVKVKAVKAEDEDEDD